MEKTCACAELPAVLGTQSLPTSPPVSSSGFSRAPAYVRASVARPHMCAREKQVRSIITLAPRAHFLGSRRRRVRLPTAAHSAGTLAPGPPRATASPVPRQGPGRRALGAGPCRGHGRRRRLGRAGPTYSLSRTCRPDRLGAPAAGLPSGLQSHASGITYKSA